MRGLIFLGWGILPRMYYSSDPLQTKVWQATCWVLLSLYQTQTLWCRLWGRGFHQGQRLLFMAEFWQCDNGLGRRKILSSINKKKTYSMLYIDVGCNCYRICVPNFIPQQPSLLFTKCFCTKNIGWNSQRFLLATSVVYFDTLHTQVITCLIQPKISGQKIPV